jgi:hypothetical protein
MLIPCHLRRIKPKGCKSFFSWAPKTVYCYLYFFWGDFEVFNYCKWCVRYHLKVVISWNSEICPIMYLTYCPKRTRLAAHWLRGVSCLSNSLSASTSIPNLISRAVHLLMIVIIRMYNITTLHLVMLTYVAKISTIIIIEINISIYVILWIKYDRLSMYNKSWTTTDSELEKGVYTLLCVLWKQMKRNPTKAKLTPNVSSQRAASWLAAFGIWTVFHSIL